MFPQRNLNPRFKQHIARARRMRIIGGALLVTCLLIGTGAALSQTQLPHQLTAKLKPIATELGNSRSQLPSAISQRIPDIDLELPSANQLAASATSFPQSVAEKVRNLFCRWLGCESDLAATSTSRISNNQLTNTGAQQRATLPQNVNPPAPIPQTSPSDVARSATTTSVVVSNSASSASPAPTSPQQPARIIERTNTVIQSGLTEALLDARLATLEASIAQRMAATENANSTSFRSVSQSSGSNSTGSVAASTITGTITNAIETASAVIASLTATELVATNATTTNATTTNLHVSGTATIGSGTGVLQSNAGVVSTLANGSDGQVLKVVSGALQWATDLAGGGGASSAWATTTDDLALYPADATDVVLIGTSATTTTGNILEVSGNSLLRGTITAYGAATAPTFTATSSTATSTLPRLNISGSLGLGTDYVTDLTGTGLAISSGALTLDTSGDWVGTLGGFTAPQLIAAGFSTSSADAWQLNRNFFATSSADFWKSAGNFFSTTSTDYWETQQTARAADDLTNNSIEDLNDVAAITENYGDLLFWNGASWADIATSSLGLPTSVTLASYLALSDWYATTTDGLDEGSTNRYYTDARVQTYLDTLDKGFFFSTTSADYWKSVTSFFSTSSASYFASVGLAFSTTSSDYWQSQRNFFSTTSAQHFIHASSTIPKTYTANTFAGLQTFANASTSILSASTLCLDTDCRTTWPSAGSSFDYLFPNNATTTTLAFNGGLLSVGSTTIAGNATTTGMLGVGSLFLNNSRFTSLLGSGLLNTSGTLTLDTSGDWSGTLGGYTAPQLLAGSFSTTSADVWKANRDFFATTSAQYFAHSSTTIPKTYSTNTWTGTNTFSALTLGSLNGPLHANAGVLSATTSIGVLYGGTGLTTAPTYGQLFVGNSSGGYTLTATSSLGISGGASLTGTTGQLAYFSGTDTAVGTSSLFISTNSRVGIGTTNPGYTLDVTGDINFTGTLREDGNEIFASMIAPFAGSCPTGWSEYTAARGRTVVGTPNSGTNEGTVGSALTDLGTRTVTDVASHLHAVDPPSTNTNTTGAHTHTYTLLQNTGFSTGYDGTGGTIADNTSSAGDHSHSVDIASFNSGSTGVASVDVTMPYIQLTYCQKAAGADIAEWIPASEDIEKATIISIDPNNRERVIASRAEYDNSVVGVVATQPGWLIGQETKDSVQMALAGRVPMRVSLKNGEIKIGDPITTSSIPGVGMKATKAGAIVGKAMEAVNETSALTACSDPLTGRTEQCATSLVFVNISWYSPTIDVQDDYASQAANNYHEPLSIGADFETGDIVALEYRYPQKQGDSGQTEKTGYLTPASTQGYAVGVISTEIGGPGNLLRRKRENNRVVEELRIIESGKAEMNISPSSDPIQVGDPVAVAPNDTGRGAKAETAGFIVARALEAWEPDKGKGAISVMVDASWYVPPLVDADMHADDHAHEDGYLTDLFAHLVQWFADAKNGIENFFAKNLYATNVAADTGTFRSLTASSTVSGTLSATDQLCLGSVCVSEADFMAIFGTAVGSTNAPAAAQQSQSASAAASQSVPSSPSTPSEEDPPKSVSSSTPDTTPDLTKSEQPPHENSMTSSTPEIAPDDAPASSTSESLLQPANDNAPEGDNVVPANDNAPPLETAANAD